MRVHPALLTGLLLFGTTAAAVAETLEELPGYVSFETMDLLEGLEPTVEVNLKGALLTMLAQAAKHEDKELSDMLAMIHAVRVQIFPIRQGRDQAQAKAESLAKQLEADHWERIVLVRDKDEHVYVHIRTEDNLIAGLMVMVVGSDDEAAFVNIVGQIDLEQIAQFGSKLGIEPLEKIRIRRKRVEKERAEQERAEDEHADEEGDD